MVIALPLHVQKYGVIPAKAETRSNGAPVTAFAGKTLKITLTNRARVPTA